MGRHGVVCLFWVVTVLFVWSDIRCHGDVRLGGFGLSRCCLLGRLWVMMVLSAWSALVVLGCYGVVCLVSFGCYYGVVCLVRLGGFGLKIDQTVLFVWSILDCHGSICLVRLDDFRMSRLFYLYS